LKPSSASGCEEIIVDKLVTQSTSNSEPDVKFALHPAPSYLDLSVQA